MSLAWEVTDDDVDLLFQTVNIPLEHRFKACQLFKENDARITKAALQETDMEAQTLAAYDEMKQILRENGIT